MDIPWNIVTRNLEDHELPQKKLRAKIEKFAKHLSKFPPDAVHLHIVLERNAKKDCYTARLTLRMPSNILHVEENADHLEESFDHAVKAMLRELEEQKADIRTERLWKRRARREKLHRLKAMGFAPVPEQKGPRDYHDIVRALFSQHYKELLRHARRHIHQEESAGVIPKDSIDAGKVLAEVEKRAVAKAEERPKDAGWSVWFYQLVHEELKRQQYLLKRGGRAHAGEGDAQVAGPDPAPPSRGEQHVPTKSAGRPEASPAFEFTLGQKDAVKRLEEDARHWSREERTVFDLYYVEGFEPEEISVITGEPIEKVQEHIATLHGRLREEMLKQAAA
jgi:DNA-directed RNA polymerase specialized sigma24 family protein/ribosome-associated translation inhibitor RaiA